MGEGLWVIGYYKKEGNRYLRPMTYHLYLSTITYYLLPMAYGLLPVLYLKQFSIPLDAFPDMGFS